MMNSTVAQDSHTHLPSVAGSRSDKRHSVRVDKSHAETVSWTPDLVLAQSPDVRDAESESLMAATTDVIKAGWDQFRSAGDEAWDLLMHALLQSGTLQASGTPIDRADMLVRKTASFVLNGGPHNRLLKDVNQWLQGLVAADPSLFEFTSYTLDALAACIVQESTAALISGNIHKMKGRHEGKVDVPILRLPDAKHPYLTVYRIRVDVWSSKQRAFVVRQSDELVLSGQYNVRYFKLRPESTLENAHDPDPVPEELSG
ncbi:hypothetical protein AURDEDRAFT_164363 [Auricularia subglabra TFB-10046 SS5]|nr:hypothetical protein AURDEDRAFT_164363 [Auricularia subglabra TFB-10046 SS5]